jgi:ATP-binding cassette subfamily F protein 3
MIAGEIEATEGKIVMGSNVQLGYYAQHHAEALHRDSTIFQEISEVDPTSNMTRVRSIAGAFLFSDDDVEKKVGVLSGGERARVALARLLIKPGNLLLMDEPTNHLDLASAEALAESLEGYDGTLIFVSHNRAFIRRLATRIWNVEGGTVETYPGTLDEYMDTCRQRQEAEEAGTALPGKPAPKQSAAKPLAAPSPIKAPSAANGSGKPQAAPSAAVSAGAGSKPNAPAAEPDKAKEAPKKSKNQVAKLERESSDLETKITALEAAQKERSELLADPDVYADKARSTQLLSEFRAAQPELDKLTARWEQVLQELEELGRSA